MTETQAKILTALNESGAPMTSRELAKATGVTGPTAKGNADKLLKSGDIKSGPKRGNAFTYVGTGVEAPAEEPKVIEEGRIECQVCEDHYCEGNGGTLWNHGYQRPGWGWLVGGCFGVGHKPFPATNRLEDYLVAVEDRRKTVEGILAKQDEWPTLSYQVRAPGDCWNKKMKTVTITRPTAEEVAEQERAYASHSALSSRAYKATKGEAEPLTAEEKAQDEADLAIWRKLFPAANKWESEHRAKVWRLESELRSLASEIERVTKRIAKGRELRGLTVRSEPATVDQDTPEGDDMPKTTTTYATFAKQHGIKLSAERVSENPNLVSKWEADHWKVTLRKGRKRMSIFYSKGLGHEGVEPTAPEVLCCLALDASTIDASESFESWADEFGMDTDSREAEKTYKHTRKQADRLRSFLGDEYGTLLTAEEEG